VSEKGLTVCVCMCVYEREREREREGDPGGLTQVDDRVKRQYPQTH